MIEYGNTQKIMVESDNQNTQREHTGKPKLLILQRHHQRLLLARAALQVCCELNKCTTWFPWFVGIYRGFIIPGFVRCETDLVQPQEGEQKLKNFSSSEGNFPAKPPSANMVKCFPTSTSWHGSSGWEHAWGTSLARSVDKSLASSAASDGAKPGSVTTTTTSA